MTRWSSRAQVIGYAILFFAAAPAFPQEDPVRSITRDPHPALAVSAIPAPTVAALRAASAGLSGPVRIATDAAGHVYISDSKAGRILVRDEQGRLVSMKRGLDRPLGVAVDPAGRIFVAEEGKGCVSVFLPDWTFLTKLGKGDGEFLLPNHLAIQPQAPQLVYVTDSAANLVKVYRTDGPLVLQFGGQGYQPGLLDFPAGIYVDPTGTIFVADQNNNRVQVFDANGGYLRNFGKLGMAGSTFGRIQGLAGDDQGRLYIADAFQDNVRVFDAMGASISTIGTLGDGPGEMISPLSLALDRNHRLLVVSSGTTAVNYYGLDAYADPWILPAKVALVPATVQRDGDSGRGGQDDAQPKVLIGYLSVPGYDPGQIQVGSVKANGIAADAQGTASVGDFDGSGTPVLRLRFDRRRLVATLPDGRALVTVSGTLAGLPFEGSTEITVLPYRGGAAEEGGDR